MTWAERPFTFAELEALIDRCLCAASEGVKVEPMEPETAWTATGGRLRLILRELEAASEALPSNVHDTPRLRGWLDAARILIESCERNAAINDSAEREKQLEEQRFETRRQMASIDRLAMEAAALRQFGQARPNVA